MALRHLAMGLAAAALLAAGCASTTVHPYETMTSMARAQREADVVAEGTVLASDDFEHLPAGEVWSNVLGKLGQDCVVKTRITLELTRVMKSPGEMKSPIHFWYQAPCFHAEPDVLMGVSLPAVLSEGDRLRVYLERRQGEYWLIAHDKVYANPHPATRQPPGPPPAAPAS
jgi:hypothetical protein